MHRKGRRASVDYISHRQHHHLHTYIRAINHGAGLTESRSVTRTLVTVTSVTSVTRDPTRPTDSSNAARSRVHSMQRFKLRAQR